MKVVIEKHISNNHGIEKRNSNSIYIESPKIDWRTKINYNDSQVVRELKIENKLRRDFGRN